MSIFWCVFGWVFLLGTVRAENHELALLRFASVVPNATKRQPLPAEGVVKEDAVARRRRLLGYGLTEYLYNGLNRDDWSQVSDGFATGPGGLYQQVPPSGVDNEQNNGRQMVFKDLQPIAGLKAGEFEFLTQKAADDLVTLYQEEFKLTSDLFKLQNSTGDLVGALIKQTASSFLSATIDNVLARSAKLAGYNGDTLRRLHSLEYGANADARSMRRLDQLNEVVTPTNTRVANITLVAIGQSRTPCACSQEEVSRRDSASAIPGVGAACVAPSATSEGTSQTVDLIHIGMHLDRATQVRLGGLLPSEIFNQLDFTLSGQRCVVADPVGSHRDLDDAWVKHAVNQLLHARHSMLCSEFHPDFNVKYTRVYLLDGIATDKRLRAEFARHQAVEFIRNGTAWVKPSPLLVDLYSPPPSPLELHASLLFRQNVSREFDSPLHTDPASTLTALGGKSQAVPASLCVVGPFHRALAPFGQCVPATGAVMTEGLNFLRVVAESVDPSTSETTPLSDSEDENEAEQSGNVLLSFPGYAGVFVASSRWSGGIRTVIGDERGSFLYLTDTHLLLASRLRKLPLNAPKLCSDGLVAYLQEVVHVPAQNPSAPLEFVLFASHAGSPATSASSGSPAEVESGLPPQDSNFNPLTGGVPAVPWVESGFILHRIDETDLMPASWHQEYTRLGSGGNGMGWSHLDRLARRIFRRPGTTPLTTFRHAAGLLGLVDFGYDYSGPFLAMWKGIDVQVVSKNQTLAANLAGTGSLRLPRYAAAILARHEDSKPWPTSYNFSRVVPTAADSLSGETDVCRLVTNLCLSDNLDRDFGLSSSDGRPVVPSSTCVYTNTYGGVTEYYVGGEKCAWEGPGVDLAVSADGLNSKTVIQELALLSSTDALLVAERQQQIQTAAAVRDAEADAQIVRERLITTRQSLREFEDTAADLFKQLDRSKFISDEISQWLRDLMQSLRDEIPDGQTILYFPPLPSISCPTDTASVGCYLAAVSVYLLMAGIVSGLVALLMWLLVKLF